ncbi:MAG: hypothetical protein UY58_C0003G0038 [Candidatus Magasanikbacteria bacterium GW2011_GWA2_50_22]|uniref:Uncharacterized protein n=1 Tax=Candidatus Magasanikbacteria bacterium GW2011_GWA2_50_22 TaxID=1619043 RepID=A0A0G1WF87_9BACT|nr:MAG: hypothetical protein UY58_C0003G0038 [Candidatus Magasanikbacteria bacterium GW2011_GWA2_50_22]
MSNKWQQRDIASPPPSSYTGTGFAGLSLVQKDLREGRYVAGQVRVGHMSPNDMGRGAKAGTPGFKVGPGGKG